MTVATEQSAIVFTGIVDGVALNVPFPVQATTELKVRYGSADTLAVIGTHYTVALVPPEYLTATVTPVVGFAALSGGTVSVRREIPYTQPSDIPTLATLSSARLEQMFDRVVFIAQQLRDKLAYSLQFPSIDQPSSVGALPSVTERASKFLAFDSFGKPVAAIGPTSTGTPFSTFGTAWVALSGAANALLTLGFTTIGTVGQALVAATTMSAARNIVGLGDSDNVRDYGALGDDATNDRAALAAADAASALYFPRGSYRISSDVTLASDVYFERGASLRIDNGVTVTFSGNVAGYRQQIFKGAGLVLLNGQADEVYPEWWGAKNTTAVSSSAAIQAADTAVPVGTVIKFGRGDYLFSTAVTLVHATLEGADMRGTRFRPDATFAATSAAMVTLNAEGTAIRNIEWNADVIATPSCTAIKTGAAAGRNVIEDNYIYNFAYGFDMPAGNAIEFNRNRIQACGTSCVKTGGISGQYFGDCTWFHNTLIPKTGGYGWIIDMNTNAQYCHGHQTIAGYVHIYVRGAGSYGGGDTVPQNLFFFDGNFDEASQDIVYLEKCNTVEFDDCNISGATNGHGVNAQGAAATDVDGLVLDNCLIRGNGLAGVNFGKGCNLKIEGGRIYANSKKVAGAEDNVHVGGDALGLVEVKNVMCGLSNGTELYSNVNGSARYAITLDSGALTTAGVHTGRLHISGCVVSGCTTGTISNGAAPSGGALVVASNL